MKKILIIDDDLDILETMGTILEHEGYGVQSADTVERGMELIGEYSPDLILLDVMFPEKKTKGFEAASEIRKNHPGIPVFVLTAINRQYAFDFTEDDVPADEFLNKPVNTESLLELIKRHTGE
jgi:DNA-binding response OmpR family regulator